MAHSGVGAAGLLECCVMCATCLSEQLGQLRRRDTVAIHPVTLPVVRHSVSTRILQAARLTSSGSLSGRMTANGSRDGGETAGP